MWKEMEIMPERIFSLSGDKSILFGTDISKEINI